MIRPVLFVALSILLNISDTFGFRSIQDDGEFGVPSDGPTLLDPRTHRSFIPHLVGKPGVVTLSYSGRAVNWDGLISTNGPISMWGRPIFQLPPQTSFQQIDQILKAFIDENFLAFGVKSTDLKNDQGRTKYSGPFKYITYQRYFRLESAPFSVQGAFITFRFKNDRLIQITNNSFGKIGAVEAPTVGMDEALQSVYDDAKYDEEKDRVSSAKAELQPFYGSDRRIHFRFVYQISILKRFPVDGSYSYSVSALDGRIVRIMSGIHTATAMGEIYPRFKANGLKMAPLSEVMVKSGSSSELSDPSGNFSDADNATAVLAGARVDVKVNSRTPIVEKTNKEGNIVFSAANSLSENMAYVHIARVNAFVRNFIKTPATNASQPEKNFLDQPIQVSTHTIDSRMKGCNAWFSSARNNLNFLSEDAKCYDSAQFADIIYHEWGHALDNALGGIQDGAFSEGIGDITSMLMTGDSKIGPGFIKERGDQPIRDISSFRHYPEGQDEDPHKESLIVSGSWFDFYKSMQDHYGAQDGRMKVAEIFFKHLISTDSYTDSYQGALIVDDDDGNLENCTPHMCFLNAAFSKHGLASPDARCSGNEIEGKPSCSSSTIIP